MTDLNIDIQHLVVRIAEILSTWGLRVLGALVVLLIGRIVAGWLRAAVDRATAKAKIDATLRPFISGLIYYVALAAVLVAVLGIIGIQTASIIAVLGAAGLAVGLALQGTLSNFSAGFMLLLFRPFKVGDFVDIAGTSGTVDIVGLFVTTLHTPDNVQILVPNAQVWGKTIKNFNANDNRRNDLLIGISYDDDIGRALEIVNQVVSADERVLADPAPVIAVSELGDSSVNLVVRPWCARGDYWALRFDLLRRIKEQLEAGGCSIPYPQRDVHLFETASSPVPAQSATA